MAAALLLVVVASVSSSHARYGGGVVLKSYSRFGAIGVAGGYRTSTAALKAARTKAGGTSHAWSGRWWSNQGYGSTARGYDRHAAFVQPAYAYGYGTASSAKNAAKSSLGSYYRYSVAAVSVYNN